MLQSRQFETPVPNPTPPQTKRKLDENAPDVDPSGSGLQLDAETERSLAETALREGIDIPEAKRRAQNRAAQRAFRERKEKHLKDLEARLAELESESRSWKTTNIALRNKLSLLENELQRYRWSEGGNNAPMPELPAHLQNSPFQQQQQQQQPQQPPLVQRHQQQQEQSPTSSYQHSPYQQRQLAQARHSPATSSSGSVPGIVSDTSSGSSSALNSRASNADDFCAKLSTACVVDSKKIAEDAPYISADYPGWQNDALYGTNNSIEYWLQNGGKAPPSASAGLPTPQSQVGSNYPSQTSLSQGQTQPASNNSQSIPHSSIPDPNPSNQFATKRDSFSDLLNDTGSQNTFNDPLNLDFGTTANGFGGFTLEESKSGVPDFGGLMNNDFGVFDPLDGLLEWNPPKEETQGAGLDASDSASGSTPTSASQVVSNNSDNKIAGDYPKDYFKNYPNDFSNDFTPDLPGELANIPDGLSDNREAGPYSSQDQTVPASQFLGLNSPMFPDSNSPLGGALDDNAFGNGVGDAQEDQVPIASQRFIQCADAWDRICSHPRFGEIDINSMCQELRNKARCSKSGVVLDEEDVNAVLKSMK